MSPDQQNFEQLRRLLTLKRYEQPPPRYYNDFSLQVIARIRAGQHQDAVTGLGWLQRLWSALEARPAMGGAFAVLVGGALMTAVVYSESDSGPLTLVPAQTESTLPIQQMADSQALPPLRVTVINSEIPDSLAGGLGAPAQPASLFEELRKTQQPVLQPAAWNSFSR